MDTTITGVEAESVPGDDYMLEQLKKVMSRRESAMDRLRQIYVDDPRNKRSPIEAGIAATLGNGSTVFNGRNTYEGMAAAADKQRQLLQDNKLAPELMELEMTTKDPFFDLYERVLKSRKDSKNDGWQMFHSAENGVGRLHVPTGRTELLMSGTLYAKQKQSLAENFFNKLAAENSGASIEELRDAAERMAEKTLLARVNEASNGGASTVTPLPMGAGQRQPATSRLNTNEGNPPTALGNLSRESAVAEALNFGSDESLPPQQTDPSTAGSFENGFGRPAHSDPTNDPRFNVASKEGVENLPTRTPQQKQAQEEMGKRQVEQYLEMKDQLGSFHSATQAMLPMEGALLAGKTTSGVAHEALNKVGGYLNYLDPKNSLAEAAGNDAAYFSNMMNLVRDKIKALGSGTAVSNLDLIVTQKSVGDLRNTPQGNLKTIALMKLYNATMSDLNQDKIDYYDNGRGTFEKFKPNTEPKYAVRAKRHAVGRETMYSYDVQSKSDWIAEQQRNNPGKTIPKEVLDKEWKRFADDSVRAMFK